MKLRWPKISGEGSGSILRAKGFVGPGWPSHLSGPGSGDITKKKPRMVRAGPYEVTEKDL